MYQKRIPKHLLFEPYPKRRSKAWLGWLVVVVISTAFGVLAMKANAQENAEPDAGTMRFISNNHQKASGMHLGTQVDASIDGMLVTVDYVQQFKNTSNEWVEAVYTFPLPEQAAVQHMEMRIGERRIIGKVKERKAATRIYQQAMAEGRQAALTEQQRPNLFTQRVANIAPGEAIEVRLQFINKARYQQGFFEWRLPTTLTPRYIPGTLLPTVFANIDNNEGAVEINQSGFGWAGDTDEVPDASWITPPMRAASSVLSNPLSLNIALNSGMQLTAVNSLYHQMMTERQGDRHLLRLQDGQTEMDRDFVIQWHPTPSQQPRAAIFQQTKDNEHYLMFMLMPPTQQETQTLPRDITFIIDTSGSMQGNSITQAKAALTFAINQLADTDRFNVIAFADGYQMLFSSPQYAGSAATELADGWVSRLDADGGTEMLPALAAAFAQSGDPERLQQVVFITDGAVGNETALFGLIEQQAGAARLFTVGIGSAPNSYFMSMAADIGRGTFEYIAESKDVQQGMGRLFSKLNHAMAKNVTVDWPATAEVFPRQQADIYFGEPLMAFAKVDTAIQTINVTGETASDAWQRTVSAYQVKDSQGIAALWARNKIDDLEGEQRRGVLSEEATKSAITDLALKHNLLSRYTAFVAVDEPIVRPSVQQLQREMMANRMAQSQQMRAVPFPRTATTAELSFWLGALLSLLLLGLYALPTLCSPTRISGLELMRGKQ